MSKPRPWLISARRWLMPTLFLILLLGVGLSIYDDYGISWDELSQLEIGKANYRYIVKGDASLLELRDRYYGPLFEIFLVRMMKQVPSREMYLSRHLWTFFAFVGGVVVFYFLLRQAYQNKPLAWIGACCLVLSPRIFADAFYNSKDIPFLAGTILAALMLLLYLRRNSLLFLLLYALCTGAAIAIRFPGFFILAMTLFMLLVEVGSRRLSPFRAIRDFTIYSLASLGFLMLFMPVLWRDPFGGLAATFQTMGNFPHYLPVLFQGTFISPAEIPWYYIPVWIGITTPLAYLLMALVGFSVFLFAGVRRPAAIFGVDFRHRVMAVLWLFGPWLATLAFHSSLYDGWRQMFFIYPALIVFVVEGLSWIDQVLRKFMRSSSLGAIRVVGVVILFAPVLTRMVMDHPYQNVYFNRLAGPDMQYVKQRFDLDYWGLAYYEGLVALLESDPASQIYVNADTPAGVRNAALLVTEQESRLRFVDDPGAADYFIGGYRWHPEDYPYSNEIYSVRVGNANLLSVFKLR